MLSEHVVRISDIGGISCIRLSSLLREQKFLSGMAFSNYEVFFVAVSRQLVFQLHD